MYIGNGNEVGAAGSSTGTIIGSAFGGGYLGARNLFNSSARSAPGSTPTPASRPRATQPPTPSRAGTTANPPRTAPRAAGVIPFAEISGTSGKNMSDFSYSARNITSGYGMPDFDVPKYHSGGRVGYAKSGEVTALLQTGETVLTGQLTDKLTPLLESIVDGRMGMGDITNNIVINGANKSPEQIADIVINKINTTMKRQTGGNRI
jgi:hypothetical protein